MEFYSLEKIVLAIIVVIVTWIGCMAIIKWIWTPVERLFGYVVENGEPISQDNPELVNAVASASLPSSPAESSSAARPWKYDVFLSFRGPDTRKGITHELYERLDNRGIKTFKDDQDLEGGDAISPTLLEAIEESRFAIVVLSEKYASSAWCLDELTHICRCMRGQNRILPLFYNVEPTDVRFQKKSFEAAFTDHETSGRHGSEKLQKWRGALKEVASFSGWDTKNFHSDKELVQDLVEHVFSKVPPIEIDIVYFQEFEETGQAMTKVMKGLEDDKVTAVGVYGMGGVGKTALAKHVGAQSKKKGIFHYVIVGVVSQNPDLIKIQGSLYEQLLGKKLEVMTQIGRAAELNKEIMRRKKILIILDDVWNTMKLSDIGIPSNEELQKCNSKVLLTTRRRHVCHSMETQATIPLNILSKVDSWTLFVRNARRPFESTNFEEVARKVAGECSGLPLALIAVAKALGDKDQVEWESAARRLEKSQHANPDEERVVFECIKLSYDYLNDEDSKSCFLLCCLFPEDYNIPIEDLFRYALYRQHDTFEEARGKADTVATHLKNCSLLLEGEYGGGFVRMHDVIRDTAVKIAVGHGYLVKAGCGLKNWRSPLHEDYSTISLMKNETRKLFEEPVCPKLQTLLLRENVHLNEIPETFFQSPNQLRVLDLSNTSISLLPQSFSLLTNLQALYLDFCKKIMDFSSLGKLTKLEILSMREYPLKELWREIGHLKNLRMLDISAGAGYSTNLKVGRIVRIPSKVISKLHELEELYMLGCGFRDWGIKIEGEGEETNIGFEELTGLSNLKVLQVCIHQAKFIPKNVEVKPNWIYFRIYIGGSRSFVGFGQEDYNSRYLELEGTTINNLPDWFVNAVTTKTEELTYDITEYDYCKELSNILMEYDHGRLHKLKHLRLDGYFYSSMYNSKLEESMYIITRVPKEPVFENLEELRLDRLSFLKELCVGELPPGSFFNLKVLVVFFCYNLENVSKLLQRLSNVEKLGLNCTRKMEYVFGCEGFEPEQSKLREIYLLGPNFIKSICNGPAPCAMFKSLKSLTIYRCKLLQSVLASDVAQCLSQLEDLFVERCPLLERVIEAVNKKIVLPKLKNLVLKKLPMVYIGTATADIECPSLEHLFLEECPHLSSSISASDYFCSKNQIQLNNQQQYEFLSERCNRVTPMQL